jgi:hypothetical protein
MATCSSCGAAIEWAITPTDVRMPLDAHPVDRQGAVLAAWRRPDGQLAVRPMPAAGGFLWPDEHPARSHFATCPNADRHRRPR